MICVIKLFIVLFMLRIIIVYDNQNYILKELCVNQLIKHLESINAEVNYNGEELSEE